jgi:hypothetical protein
MHRREKGKENLRRLINEACDRLDMDIKQLAEHVRQKSRLDVKYHTFWKTATGQYEQTPGLLVMMALARSEVIVLPATGSPMNLDDLSYLITGELDPDTGEIDRCDELTPIESV